MIVDGDIDDEVISCRRRDVCELAAVMDEGQYMAVLLLLVAVLELFRLPRLMALPFPPPG